MGWMDASNPREQEGGGGVRGWGSGEDGLLRRHKLTGLCCCCCCCCQQLHCTVPPPREFT